MHYYADNSWCDYDDTFFDFRPDRSDFRRLRSGLSFEREDSSVEYAALKAGLNLSEELCLKKFISELTQDNLESKAINKFMDGAVYNLKRMSDEWFEKIYSKSNNHFERKIMLDTYNKLKDIDEKMQQLDNMWKKEKTGGFETILTNMY